MKKIIFAAALSAVLGSFAAVPFKIGIAGYTFYKKSLDESLTIMRKIDCRYLCHKDFFLKYDASDAEIAAYLDKTSKYGVKTLATGPLYAKDEATVRAQFEFAKKLGVKPSKVHEYRRAGLIRMFRTGTGFMCTGKEFERFTDMLTENEMDLSTPEKIILAGQQIKGAGWGQLQKGTL